MTDIKTEETEMANGRVMRFKTGRCCCGRRIGLDDFTNTCECGRDYNWNGTLLAPREQWGKETGESLADIIGPRQPGEEW